VIGPARPPNGLKAFSAEKSVLRHLVNYAEEPAKPSADEPRLAAFNDIQCCSMGQ
jgi:hypothetical protein